MFPDTPTVRHDLAVNYSNLKRLDDQIAAIISDLKEDGLYEETYIFFYGDHGGPFPRYKRALYDTGVQVPMVIKFRGTKGPVKKTIVSLVFLIWRIRAVYCGNTATRGDAGESDFWGFCQ